MSGVTFRLVPGEALQLTGRNGTGKSTLLRALAGLLPLAEGRLTLAPAAGPGRDDLAEELHLVGHADGLKPALTARENLEVAAALGGRPGAPVEAALDRLGVAHLAGLPVAYCSAGQRRRVALARLLTSARAVWLLDEPTTAIDAPAQAVLSTMMAEHRAAGGLVIVATHMAVGLRAPLFVLELGA